MFKRINKAKTKTVEFVKENAPLIVPHILGVAAIVYVYSNETQKRTVMFGDHLNEIETNFHETNSRIADHYEKTHPITE